MARQPSATANWTRAPSSTRRPRPGPVSVWATEGRMPRGAEVAAVQPRQTRSGPPSTKRVVARDRAPAGTRLHPAGGGAGGHPHQIAEGTRSGSVRAGAQRDVVDEEQKVVIRAESPSKPRTSSTKRRSRPIWSGMITAPTVESASRGETAGDAETAYTCSRSPRASEAAVAMVAKAVDRPDRGPPMIRQGRVIRSQVSPSWSCSSGDRPARRATCQARVTRVVDRDERPQGWQPWGAGEADAPTGMCCLDQCDEASSTVSSDSPDPRFRWAGVKAGRREDGIEACGLLDRSRKDAGDVTCTHGGRDRRPSIG